VITGTPPSLRSRLSLERIERPCGGGAKRGSISRAGGAGLVDHAFAGAEILDIDDAAK